jgi:hypothetical protein
MAMAIIKERKISWLSKWLGKVLANLPKLLANRFYGRPIDEELGP